MSDYSPKGCPDISSEGQPSNAADQVPSNLKNIEKNAIVSPGSVSSTPYVNPGPRAEFHGTGHPLSTAMSSRNFYGSQRYGCLWIRRSANLPKFLGSFTDPGSSDTTPPTPPPSEPRSNGSGHCPVDHDNSPGQLGLYCNMFHPETPSTSSNSPSTSVTPPSGSPPSPSNPYFRRGGNKFDSKFNEKFSTSEYPPDSPYSPSGPHLYFNSAQFCRKSELQNPWNEMPRDEIPPPRPRTPDWYPPPETNEQVSFEKEINSPVGEFGPVKNIPSPSTSDTSSDSDEFEDSPAAATNSKRKILPSPHGSRGECPLRPKIPKINDEKSNPSNSPNNSIESQSPPSPSSQWWPNDIESSAGFSNESNTGNSNSEFSSNSSSSPGFLEQSTTSPQIPSPLHNSPVSSELCLEDFEPPSPGNDSNLSGNDETTLGNLATFDAQIEKIFASVLDPPPLMISPIHSLPGSPEPVPEETGEYGESDSRSPRPLSPRPA